MGMRRGTYCTCLCWLLCLGTAVASSGNRLEKCPIITVDALEVNIVMTKSETWGPNLQKVYVWKPGLAQVIFWKWVHHDHQLYPKILHRPPRMNWMSHGWMTYEYTKDENDEKNGIDQVKSKQTLPLKNYHDGYYYINVKKDGATVYKIRSKILMGMEKLPCGCKCSFTYFDPEAKDRNFRKIPDEVREPKPQEIYEAIVEERKRRWKERLSAAERAEVDSEESRLHEMLECLRNAPWPK